MFLAPRSKEHRRHSSTGSDHSSGSKSSVMSSSVHKGLKNSDAKVTIENLISAIKEVPGNRLDKESVVDTIRDMYTWIMFDKDIQLTLPKAPGDPGTSKMWPHGAVVDSRKRRPSMPKGKDPRVLQDIDEDTVSVVTSSVVSSTIDETGRSSRRGHIIYDGPSNYAIGGARMKTGRPDNFPPGGGAAEEAGEEAAENYRAQIPRYSVIGGAVPPTEVPSTPDVTGGRRKVKKVVRAKPRTGAALREGRGDEEAVRYAD